jgi:hypothetical protein
MSPKKGGVEPRVASITLPTPIVARTNTVISLAGMPISTPVAVTINPPGGGSTVRNIVTDGSGNGSVTVVFAEHGVVSASVTQTTTTTLASTSGTVSGHGLPAEAEPETETEQEEEEEEEEVDDGE